jgi:quinol monooxygenase YgiN
MIFIVVKFRVRPEHADNFASLVEPFTTATRAEPGNVCFDWYRSLEELDVYTLVEAFADGDAGAAHVNADHFKAALAQLAKLVVEVPEIVNVEVPGGWSRMAEIQPEDLVN